MVGTGVTDAHLSVKKDGEIIGQFSGGRSGEDITPTCGDGSDVIVRNRDIEAEHLRRRGEPFELSKDCAFFEFSGDDGGIQVVADDHAFNAGPVLGHVTTFLSVVMLSHHTLFHCDAWLAILLARDGASAPFTVVCLPIQRR